MTDLKDILVSGKAPNNDANAATSDAVKMQAYFSALFVTVSSAEVGDLLINTTAAGAMGSAELIPLDEVEPQPDADMKFYYQLQVKSPEMGAQMWHVASWLTSVKIHGIEAATREWMGKVTPNFNYLNFEPSYKGIVTGLETFYESC